MNLRTVSAQDALREKDDKGNPHHTPFEIVSLKLLGVSTVRCGGSVSAGAAAAAKAKDSEDITSVCGRYEMSD